MRGVTMLGGRLVVETVVVLIPAAFVVPVPLPLPLLSVTAGSVSPVDLSSLVVSKPLSSREGMNENTGLTVESLMLS